MFCGDETGAFVADLGYTNSRFGYGGDPDPKLQVPSYLSPGKNVGLSNLHAERPPNTDNTIKRIYGNPDMPGEVTDWDAWEGTWLSAGKQMSCDFKEHPILTTNPGSIPRGQKETIAEIMFEKLNAQALFIAHTPALTAFSLGRHTALVVDCGGGGNVASPIIDGMVLGRSQRRNGRGGEAIGREYLRRIEDKLGKRVPFRTERAKDGSYGTVTEEYLSKLTDGDKVQRELSIEAIMEDFKRCHGYMAQFGKLDLREVKSLIPENSVYELPDGTPVNVNDSPEIFETPEMHYKAEVIGEKRDVDSMDVEGGEGEKEVEKDHLLKNLPLHKLVHDALSSSDADARKELLLNVVVAGNGSFFPGFDTRLTKELVGLVPSTYRVKLSAGKHKEERSNAAWIGGSILTSLGSFQQLWLSKQEFEEFGSVLSCQRFPGV